MIAAAAVAFFGAGADVRAAEPPAPPRERVGMNLAGPSSLSTSWDFADLMKNAEFWTGGSVGTSTFAPTDWPTFIPAGANVGTNVRLRIGDRRPDYPGGSYAVSWEGKGEFRLGVDADRYVVASGPGSINTTIADNRNGVYLQITKTDPTDPLRNIKIQMPGVPANQTFHPTFLDRTQPFGTIRFMDWMNANGNTTVTWDQRPKTTDMRYTTNRGVPVEHMVALANQLDADPWFTMPVKADDTYVRNFAAYVCDNLEPGLKAHVEYGNEVWGFDLAQDHLRAKAQADYGNQDLWYRSWAVEAKRDFAIWRDEFGGEEDRMVRVAAAQGANRYHTPRFFNLMHANGTDNAANGERMFDAISLAAYIGGNTGGYGSGTTKDDIIDDLFASLENQMDPTLETYFGHEPSIAVTLPRGAWVWHKQMAEAYDVPLLAYEGGQHVVPTSLSDAWYDDYLAAQRDPRMYDLYTALLETYLDELGADGFVNFSSVGNITQFGAWGALEYQDQLLADAPKYRALMDYLARPVPEPATAGALLLIAAAGLGRRSRGVRN
jgi:hypothetical protein